MAMLLGARDVTVDFPGVRALDSVSLGVSAGEVVGIVGANGSGKTTLLSVLCGLRAPTAGTLVDQEGPFALSSPHDAIRKGIALVPSEPQLATTLSCWENLTLGEAVPFRPSARRRQRARAQATVAQALPHIEPKTIAGTLKKSDRALLGLQVALGRAPRILALDEPTAVLGEAGVAVVASAVRQVCDAGGAVVLVSHRLPDIVRLATYIVVLVDGRVTYSGPARQLTPKQLVEKLTEGRHEAEALRYTSGPVAKEGGSVLRLRTVRTASDLLIDALEVRTGEIVGVAGLSGSGRSRLLRFAAGDVPTYSGEASYRDGPLPRTMHAARLSGIAYIPEDRARDALFGPLDVRANLAAARLGTARSLALPVSSRQEARLASALVSRYGIRTASLSTPITSLSSGNQQRVVLARELSSSPRLVVADEPTQGVDSGGRAAIHAMLRQYADEGGATLMASSDFDELRDLSSRIVVLRDGELVASRDAGTVTSQELLALATGADDSAASTQAKTS